MSYKVTDFPEDIRNQIFKLQRDIMETADRFFLPESGMAVSWALRGQYPPDHSLFRKVVFEGYGERELYSHFMGDPQAMRIPGYKMLSSHQATAESVARQLSARFGTLRHLLEERLPKDAFEDQQGWEGMINRAGDWLAMEAS